MQVYKAFTLSVYGMCANCTRVYKVAIHKDSKGIWRTHLLIFIFQQ